MKTTKCEERFTINAQEVLQSSELFELKGGAVDKDCECEKEETGDCHGNGCNATCKKNQ